MVAKLGAAWSAYGISTWADAGQAAAFLLTTLFIVDFVWKKWLRPLLEWRGVLKPKKRRRMPDTEDGDL